MNVRNILAMIGQMRVGTISSAAVFGCFGALAGWYWGSSGTVAIIFGLAALGYGAAVPYILNGGRVHETGRPHRLLRTLLICGFSVVLPILGALWSPMGLFVVRAGFCLAMLLTLFGQCVLIVAVARVLRSLIWRRARQ